MRIDTGDIETYVVRTPASGETDRPPLLLLHGNGGSHRSFDGVIGELSKTRACYAPDARGQGRTPMGKRPLTYPQMGRDAIALIDALGLDHPDVVGYSDGGIVALEIAAHSENVGRIVTLGANFSMDFMTEEPFFVNCARYMRRSARWAWLPGVKKKRALTRLMIDPGCYDRWDALQDVRTPVLLMVGDADVIPITHTERLRDSLANAEICVVPECGHRILREAPERFLRVAVDFLDGRKE